MKINFTINKDVINSYIFSISLFLSAITIPVKQYMSSGLVVWVLYAVLLVGALFVNNNGKVEKYFISFFLFFNIFFILSFFISDNVEATLDIYLLFLKFSALPIFLFQYIHKNEPLFESLANVAKVTYFILFFSIPLIVEDLLNYMAFGVAMASTLIFIYFNDARKHKFNIINFVLIIFGLCTVFVFGNRMSFIAAVLCLFSIKVLFSKLTYFYKLFILLFFILLILLVKVYLYEILIMIQSALSFYDIDSYSIEKLIVMMDEDLISSSSGRELIFLEAITMIRNNMFLPYYLGYYQVNTDTGSPYPHNVILDILLVVGLPGLILITALYARFIWGVLNLQDNTLKYFILILSLYSMLRLSLSSTFWVEPFFWLPFFAYLSFKHKK